MASQALFNELLKANQHHLEHVIEAGGAKKLRLLFDESHAALEAKLRILGAHGKGASLSAHQARGLLAQVRMGQMQLAVKMGQAMDPLSMAAAASSLQHLGNDFTVLERHYGGAEIILPLKEAARFRGIIDQRRPSLVRTHAVSFARWGSSTVPKIEQALSLSLVMGESTHEAIDRVQDVTNATWPSAERLVRTELAGAYNVVHADGIKAAAQVIPRMFMRWNEHATEGVPPAPLDSRVGFDSLALHGQVTPANGVFTMPPDARVSPSMWGKTWGAPPNRPYDRAVVSPWRPSWGIPGWQWVGGAKKWIVDAEGNVAPEFQARAAPPKPASVRLPAAPQPSLAVPQSPVALHDRLKAHAQSLFGANFQNTSLTSRKIEAGASAMREFNGEMVLSPPTHKKLQEALTCSAEGKPLTEEHANAFAVLVHEELHGLGEWKRAIASGTSDFKEVLATPVGKSMEEGAVELKAVLHFREVARTMGVNIPANLGPKRGYTMTPTPSGLARELWGNHAYPNQVASVETLCHWAAGTNAAEVASNGPLGPGGLKVLDNVLHGWKPSQRVAELAKAIAKTQGRPELESAVEAAINQNMTRGKASQIHGALSAIFQAKP